jgi:hypothetical protein
MNPPTTVPYITEAGTLIPAFHGIEHTFSWLLSNVHVSSLDAALLLLILQHARKKIFVSNNTDKTNIVSDKCHKLSFYFDLHLLDNDLHFLDSH